MATSQTTAVQKRDFNAPIGSKRDLETLLKQFEREYSKGLPKHLTWDRVMRVGMTAMSRQPKLLQCSAATVIGAIVTASQMGLEFDGLMGEAYLVPFMNNKSRRMETQLIPGYKGLLKLARQSGQISTVQAQVVYERDKFEYSLGLEPKLVHVPFSGSDRGGRTHVYAVATLKDGGRQFEVLTAGDVAKIKASSKAKSGPWVDHEDEMWKKSALRRLCKLLPASIENQEWKHMQTAVALDEYHDDGIAQALDTMLALPESDDPLDVLAEQVEEGSGKSSVSESL